MYAVVSFRIEPGPAPPADVLNALKGALSGWDVCPLFPGAVIVDLDLPNHVHLVTQQVDGVFHAFPGQFFYAVFFQDVNESFLGRMPPGFDADHARRIIGPRHPPGPLAGTPV